MRKKILSTNVHGSFMQNGQKLEMTPMSIHRHRNEQTGNCILSNEKKQTNADLAPRRVHFQNILRRKGNQTKKSSHFTHFQVVLQKGNLQCQETEQQVPGEGWRAGSSYQRITGELNRVMETFWILIGVWVPRKYSCENASNCTGQVGAVVYS